MNGKKKENKKELRVIRRSGRKVLSEREEEREEGAKFDE